MWAIFSPKYVNIQKLVLHFASVYIFYKYLYNSCFKINVVSFLPNLLVQLLNKPNFNDAVSIIQSTVQTTTRDGAGRKKRNKQGHSSNGGLVALANDAWDVSHSHRLMQFTQIAGQENDVRTKNIRFVSRGIYFRKPLSYAYVTLRWARY